MAQNDPVSIWDQNEAQRGHQKQCRKGINSQKRQIANATRKNEHKSKSVVGKLLEGEIRYGPPGV